VLIREERTSPANVDAILSKPEASMVKNLGLYRSADGQDLISRVRNFIRTTGWTLFDHTGGFVARKSHPLYNECVQRLPQLVLTLNRPHTVQASYGYEGPGKACVRKSLLKEWNYRAHAQYTH